MFHCPWPFQFFVPVGKASVPKAVLLCGIESWDWELRNCTDFSSLLSCVNENTYVLWHYCGTRHRVRELIVCRSCYHLAVGNVQKCLAWAGLMHMYEQSFKYWGKITMKIYTLLRLQAGIFGVIFYLEI